MATLKDLGAADLLKGLVAVVVSVVATITWMDGHFLTVAQAEDLARKEKVDQLQRMITYQQLSLVDRDIADEKNKPKDKRDMEKLRMLYQQKRELKKELGVR